MEMHVETIAVIGAGQMGAGIAQVCAQAGYDVILNDQDTDALAKGKGSIEINLNRAVARERMSEAEKTKALKRIRTARNLQAVDEADVVIEAVVEKLDVKKQLFQQLDSIAKEDAILATNTSSLPITEIAAVTGRPEKVIGMHFMNPVPVMKLVEVIRAIQTD